MIATANKTLKELAVEVPGAARIFEKLGIDYCCGGNISLLEGCVQAGVRLDEVVNSLEKAHADPAPPADWAQAPIAGLVQHIVSKHHTFTRAEAVRLEALWVKVCAAHAGRHPELGVMQASFGELANELRVHMMKEEHMLFPYLTALERAALEKKAPQRAMFGSVENPVRSMMQDHDSAGEALRALRQASRGYATPQDACVSYRELYKSLEAFEADLHTHIHLENNILFPRALEMESAIGRLGSGILNPEESGRR